MPLLISILFVLSTAIKILNSCHLWVSLLQLNHDFVQVQFQMLLPNQIPSRQIFGYHTSHEQYVW